MILGILSDTHGDVPRTLRAIEAIKAHQPDHVIHCGDIGSAAVLMELAAGFMEPEVAITCVTGNVDLWEDDLVSCWPHLTVAGRFARLELAGKILGVIHGDEIRRLEQAIRNQAYDYIFTGHTHVRSDDREGRTRIINPGAVHRAREPSCAVLDLARDRLTTLPLT